MVCSVAEVLSLYLNDKIDQFLFTSQMRGLYHEILCPKFEVWTEFARPCVNFKGIAFWQYGMSNPDTEQFIMWQQQNDPKLTFLKTGQKSFP